MDTFIVINFHQAILSILEDMQEGKQEQVHFIPTSKLYFYILYILFYFSCELKLSIFIIK